VYLRILRTRNFLSWASAKQSHSAASAMCRASSFVATLLLVLANLAAPAAAYTGQAEAEQRKCCTGRHRCDCSSTIVSSQFPLFSEDVTHAELDVPDIYIYFSSHDSERRATSKRSFCKSSFAATTRSRVVALRVLCRSRRPLR
jgi:hypothetical protein